MCRRFCLLTSFMQSCKCVHPLFLESNNIYDIRACELDSAVDYACVSDVTTDLDQGIRNCSCHVDCHEVDYALTLSTSSWPSVPFKVNSLSCIMC